MDAAGAEDMTAETTPRWGSTLDSVVVYAQGAVCRRLARGNVSPDGRVRVTGLPRSLDPGSLRARVLGAVGVRVTEARVEVEAEPLGTDTPDELRREVERLRDEYAAAQGRRDRQMSLIEEVGALHPVPPARRREDPHRRTPVDAWLELAEFVDERLTGLHNRLVELEEALRNVEHELTVATDRLARPSTDAPSAHVETTVCAVLALDGTGDAEVELEYGVPGAVWVPAYRLTHRQGDGSGRLVLRASVAQRTGEDWTGVRIALATADLRRRTDLPRLRSIRIGRSQPAPAPSGWREPRPGSSTCSPDTTRRAPAQPRPSHPWLSRAAPRPGPFRHHRLPRRLRRRATAVRRPRSRRPVALPRRSSAAGYPSSRSRPGRYRATGRVPAAGPSRVHPWRPRLLAGLRRHPLRQR